MTRGPKSQASPTNGGLLVVSRMNRRGGSLLRNAGWIEGGSTAWAKEMQDKGFYVVSLVERLSVQQAAFVDLHVPVQDFTCPTPREVRRIVRRIWWQVLKQRPVYVCCGMGYGRTGLVMACLVKALGVQKPVAFVREVYCSAAVETREQEQFVDAFRVRALRLSLRLMELGRFFVGSK